MNEMLLQFIWQFSLFQPSGLFTTDGDPVTIIHPGTRNTNAGPDFDDARIRVGNTLLAGNIELHVLSSDWQKHRHQLDSNYNNIILHVVYRDDQAVRQDNFPTLELKNFIPGYVVNNYASLFQNTLSIPCANQLNSVSYLVKESLLDRMLAQRWELKAKEWKSLLDNLSGDWRNLLYWRMAANFGFKINAAPFLMLAQSIPINLLGRHKDNIHQIEALLFGQAGMLAGDRKDDYYIGLQREYGFLQKKYKLQPIPVHLWKFMRLRPANFPTIRISQFASLIHKSLHLFSKMIKLYSVPEIESLLDIEASHYWDNHYRFEETYEKATVKKLGRSSMENIIINTVAPIQFIYAKYQGTENQHEQALGLLNAIKPEQNNIIRLWSSTGWNARQASDSQAMLQLYKNYCSEKRCLECSVGLSILKSGPLK